ncbi:tetratricopeptide repeat protein [Sabulicella glaciei]|uniref:Sel1 repeat family protein n=1 Tax=Sabulicella glaciei TaxID=2984948 RepID=A0ABT3P0P8_9PROT|nr:tetratricopeptide repeat protein [Roseococcus sp. MDT2-1-1]MCW8087993.1 sel1 repeat family protein [Roseococcus sp. MDT2-1-1]
MEQAQHLASLARRGHFEAQLLFGQTLLDGHGVARDPDAAFRWFLVAGTTGDPAALNMLGRCHENGWGTDPDPNAAFPLYRRAAAAGLDWGQYNLANLLARGAGCERDMAEALRWYRAAAAQGHAKAINLVGRFLEEGWATPRDPAAARDHYRRAAEGGDFRGMCNHAQALRDEGRRAEAAHWFSRAAATGTPGFLRSLATGLRAAPEAELRALAEQVAGRLDVRAAPVLEEQATPFLRMILTRVISGAIFRA